MCTMKKMLLTAIVGTIVCGQPVLTAMETNISSSSSSSSVTTGGKGLMGKTKTNAVKPKLIGVASATKKKNPEEIAKETADRLQRAERRMHVLKTAAEAEQRNRVRNNVAAQISNGCALVAGVALPLVLFPGLGTTCGSASCTPSQMMMRQEIGAGLWVVGVSATKVGSQGLVKYVIAPALESLRLLFSWVRRSFGEKVLNEDTFLQALKLMLQDFSSDKNLDRMNEEETIQGIASLQQYRSDLVGLKEDMRALIDTIILISNEYGAIIGRKAILDNATRAIIAGGKDAGDRDDISNCLNSFIQNYKTNVFLVVDSCEQCKYSAKQYAVLKEAVTRKKVATGEDFVKLINSDAFYAELATNNTELSANASFRNLCIAALFDFAYNHVDDHIREFIIRTFLKYHLVQQKLNQDAASQAQAHAADQQGYVMVLEQVSGTGHVASVVDDNASTAATSSSSSSSSTSSTVATTIASTASQPLAPLTMTLNAGTTEPASASTASSLTTSEAMDTSAEQIKKNN